MRAEGWGTKVIRKYLLTYCDDGITGYECSDSCHSERGTVKRFREEASGMSPGGNE